MPTAFAVANPIGIQWRLPPSAAAASAPAQAGRWRLARDESDEWYVHAETGETAWALPPGAELEADGAPLPASREGLPAGWREVSDGVDTWYVDPRGEARWTHP